MFQGMLLFICMEMAVFVCFYSMKDCLSVRLFVQFSDLCNYFHEDKIIMVELSIVAAIIKITES